MVSFVIYEFYLNKKINILHSFFSLCLMLKCIIFQYYVLVFNGV